MTAMIVDTDVASFLFKEDTRGDLYASHLAPAVASISFMTLAELEQWAVCAQLGAAPARRAFTVHQRPVRSD